MTLGPFARDKVVSGVEMLDHYISGKFELGSTPVSVRLGRQVISWGESTFIPNGINVINPIDVAHLRAPGSELREALLPVYAWDTSVALTDKLSIEALWLLEFRRTEIDPAGTYFSTNDFASHDGKKVMLGFGALADNQLLGAIPRGPVTGSPVNTVSGAWPRTTSPPTSTTPISAFYYLKYTADCP